MVNLVSYPTSTAPEVENCSEQLKLEATKARRVPVMPAPVPKGLPNLGNTCFFNATLQCLLNTEAIDACLDAMLNRRIHIEEPCRIKLSNANKSVELPAMDVVVTDGVGPMTSALKGLVKEFHAGRSPNPQGLFNQVAKRVPRFRGYQQQDAQELLTQVLDGVRDEELQAIRRALKLSLPGAMEVSPQLINVLCSGLAKPSIDSTFGGTLQQRIVCCNCGHNSLLQEPFLQLSLPLTWPSTHNVTCPNHPPSGKRQPQAANGRVGKGGSPRTSINGAVENGSPIAAVGSQNNKPSKHQRKKEAKRKRKENKQKRVALRAIQGQNPILLNGAGEGVEGSVGMAGEVPPEAATIGFTEEVNGVDHPTLDAGIEETTGTAQGEEKVETGVIDNELDEGEEDEDAELGGHHNGTGPIDMEGETLAAAVVNAQGNYDDDDSAPLSLHAVLRRFTDPERLDGQNAYECEKCSSINPGGQPKEKRPATKRYLINRPPSVLTLHLKRFEKVQHGKRVATKKFSARVDYPLTLDLAPFCNKTAEGVDANQNQVIYRLYGIVSHRGGLSGGHYVAYVRAGKRRAMTRSTIEQGAKPPDERGAMNGAISVRAIEAGIALLAAAENGPSGKGAKRRERQVSRLAQQQQQNGVSDDGDQQWYCCNDSSVTPVDVKSIQRGVEAYILFYERVL